MMATTVAHHSSLNDETVLIDSTLDKYHDTSSNMTPESCVEQTASLNHHVTSNPSCYDVDGGEASSYEDIFEDDYCNPTSVPESFLPSSLTPEDIRSMNGENPPSDYSISTIPSSDNEMNQLHFASNTIEVPANNDMQPLLQASYSKNQLFSCLLNGSFDEIVRDPQEEKRIHHKPDNHRHPEPLIFTPSFDANATKTKLKEHAASVHFEKRKTFPHQIHEMLDEVEKNNLAHIVSWQPHGRCFVVHDPKAFVRLVMPQLFRQTKWSSFQRQLNLYGFTRLTDGPDKGGYFHVLFLRGERRMCDKILRTRIKGTRVRVASDPDLEPNFYTMPAIDDIAASSKSKKSSSFLPLSITSESYQDRGHVYNKKQLLPNPFYSRHPRMQSSIITSVRDHAAPSAEITDDPRELQTLFAEMGKPINLDDLDQLPQDDIGWGYLLENILDDI